MRSLIYSDCITHSIIKVVSILKLILPMIFYLPPYIVAHVELQKEPQEYDTREWCPVFYELSFYTILVFRLSLSYSLNHDLFFSA
jgi:fucose 4-O-acetylase-like acetyltransferase